DARQHRLALVGDENLRPAGQDGMVDAEGLRPEQGSAPRDPPGERARADAGQRSGPAARVRDRGLRHKRRRFRLAAMPRGNGEPEYGCQHRDREHDQLSLPEGRTHDVDWDGGDTGSTAASLSTPSRIRVYASISSDGASPAPARSGYSP